MEYCDTSALVAFLVKLLDELIPPFEVVPDHIIFVVEFGDNTAGSGDGFGDGFGDGLGQVTFTAVMGHPAPNHS